MATLYTGNGAHKYTGITAAQTGNKTKTRCEIDYAFCNYDVTTDQFPNLYNMHCIICKYVTKDMYFMHISVSCATILITSGHWKYVF